MHLIPYNSLSINKIKILNYDYKVIPKKFGHVNDAPECN